MRLFQEFTVYGNPCWSPSGTQLVFSATRPGATSDREIVKIENRIAIKNNKFLEHALKWGCLAEGDLEEAL